MNGRQAKKLRRKAKELTVEWLQALLSEHEASKINLQNFEDICLNRLMYMLIKK